MVIQINKENDAHKTFKMCYEYKWWIIKINVDNNFIWWIVPVHSQYILNAIYFKKSPKTTLWWQFPDHPRHEEAGLPTNHRTAAAIASCVVDPDQCLCNDMCSCTGDMVCPCPQRIVDQLISQVTVPDVSTDIPGLRTFVSEERHASVTPEMLSEWWGIALVQARSTIKVTTQKGVCSAILPLSRRYRADRVSERPLLQGNF